MALTEEEKKKAIELYNKQKKLSQNSKKSGPTEPKMTKEEAAKSTKEQNKKVKQDAKKEKEIMAGRTDPNLYKTEAKPKTETEVTPKKTTNNATGKAQQFSYVANKPASFSAKAISSEAEKKPMSATQYGKTQLSNQIYDKYRTIEKYYNDPTGNSLEKGLFNRLRSAGGETVENIARIIDDNISDNPEERMFNSKFADFLNTNAKNVIAKNTAGQIGDLADQQIMQAKENTGNFGDFLIDTADAGANMASQAILASVLLPGAPTPVANKVFSGVQGVSAGAQKYVDTREAGGNKAEAFHRGIGSGAISAITEGLTGIGKTGVSKIPGVDRVVTHLDEFATKNWLTNVLSTGLGEGGEEGLEYAFEYASDVIADLIYKGEIETDFNVAELFQNVASGFVLGAGFGGVGGTANAYQNYTPKTETNVSAEAPVAPVEPPVIETENVTPEVQNEQEGAFANAEETKEATPTMIDRIVQLASEGRGTAEIENIFRQEYDVTNEKEPENKIGVQDKTEYIPEDAQNNAREDEEYKGGAHPNTVGGMQSQNSFYKALNEFGAQSLRKEQIAKDNYFEVPNQIAPGVAMSEDIGYMAGSKLGDDDYMDDVIQHPEKYAHQINTDAGSMQRAIDDIKNNGLDETYGVWRDKIDHNKMIEKDDITKAAMTALFYQNKAKTETDPQKKAEYRKKSLDIKTDINYAATKGGQLLQSLQVLQKLVDTNGINLKEDGEYMANRLVEKLNKDRKGKGKEIVLNQDLVDKAVAAAGTDAEGKAWDEVYKDLANQTSTSFWQRFNNYRYWCMLSNPRTHIRNVVSNMSMAIVNGFKDATKVPVEAAFNAYAKEQTKRAKKVDDKIEQLIASGKTSEAKKLENKSEKLHRFDDAQQKTTAIYYPKDYIFAIKDFDNAKKIFDTSGKYDSNTNNFIREYKTNQNSDPITTYLSKKIEGNNKFSKGIKTVLEHGAFGSVMDLNSWLLSDVEDDAFKSLTYAHELAQRMRANKITAETAANPENIAKMDKIRAEAFAEALYNTFNEDSKLADSIKNFSNKSVAGYLISETLLPFKKVPINILKTASDYSPIGVFKGIGEMAKVMHNPTSSDPGKAINDIAKGLTGLELMALGAFLRSIGKITNGLSDDDDEKNFQKLLGEQAFAIKFDDGSSYSMEWLGSSVMPLFAGALAYDTWNGELKNKVNSENFASVAASGLAGTLASIANPMIEMSMLSNIEYLLTNQYNDIEEVVADVLGDYANQFVPQVLNAITKTTDNTKRNVYYVDKTDNISDIIQVPYQTAMSKIPGKSQNLSAQVDAWGRVKTHSDRDTKLGWAFDAFISPGTYKKDKTTEVDEMLKQLYADTGESSILPKNFAKSFNVDGENFNLSGKQYVDAQKKKGQTAYNMLDQLIADKDFKKLSSEQKASIVSDVYSYANVKGKQEVSNYATDTKWYKNIEEAKSKHGISNADYLIAKNHYSNLDGDNKKAKMLDQLIADKGTSAKQDVALMEYIAGVDMSKYKKATSEPSKQLALYKIKNDATKGKENDLEQIQKEFKEDVYGAREIYYKSEGDWNYNIDDVIDNGKNRDKKVSVYKKFGLSEEDIVKGYNATIGYNKKEDLMAALTDAFGSKKKATTFYNILKGKKGYK